MAQAGDRTVTDDKTDRLPSIIGTQNKDVPRHQSWACGSAVQTLGVILLLVLLWYSVSGRGFFLRTGQNPHNAMEQGMLNERPDQKIDQNRPSYREYRRHETTASITGHFVLYDLLELTSQSGDIDITFTPQPRKTRAVLHLAARTGNIRVALAPDFLSAASTRDPSQLGFSPADVQKTLSRPFTNEIHSEKGSITAKVLAGNGDRTLVASDTGSLDLDIMAVGVGGSDPAALLDTETTSGSQSIRVMPLDRSKDPMITRLAAKHVSHASGDNDVVYSDEWRGSIKVISVGSGDVRVEGTDLEFDFNEPRRVEAHRGKGELVNIVSHGNGSVTFTD